MLNDYQKNTNTYAVRSMQLYKKKRIKQKEISSNRKNSHEVMKL